MPLAIIFLHISVPRWIPYALTASSLSLIGSKAAVISAGIYNVIKKGGKWVSGMQETEQLNIQVNQRVVFKVIFFTKHKLQ